MPAPLALDIIREILHEHTDDGHDHESVLEDVAKIIDQIHTDDEIPDALDRIHILVSAYSDTGHGHHHHHSFEYDPHVWLDPILAKQQVYNIRDGLILADPENGEQYMQNAAEFVQMLNDLDAKIRTELDNCKHDTFVPFHTAFTYFALRYDLNIYALGGLAPDTEATAHELVEFADYMKGNDIKVIFAEELIDPRLAEVIASETGAQVMLLSPLEAITLDEHSSGVTYLEKMENNLGALKIALECQ